MKWMWSPGFVVVAVSVAVNAQSGKPMNEPKMADTMNMTYTGCVEAVSHGGSFLLTHVGDDHQTMMRHDGMMKSDSEMAKKDEPRASNEMHGDHMMSSALVLTGRSDLRKHVGQFAVRLAPSTFAMFDAFADEAGRSAHLMGGVAAALGEHASRLLATPPVLERLDVLAAKWSN